MENGIPQTTEEFIAENKNHFQKVDSQRRKGEPYSKQQRDKRREEVTQNKVDIGCSARKISN